jgi:hypothetical protein
VQFRTILDLNTTSQPVALQDGGDYWINTSGPFTAEQVAGGLMPYKGMHVDCAAQVQVAYALVPHQGSNTQGLLTRLEKILAAAPARSKRAVFVLGELPVAASTRRSDSQKIACARLPRVQLFEVFLTAGLPGSPAAAEAARADRARGWAAS